MPASNDSGVYVPLDRDLRLRLMKRAKKEGNRNPLELAAELLGAKLEEDEKALPPARLH